MSGTALAETQRSHFLSNVTRDFASRRASLAALRTAILECESELLAALKIDLGKSSRDAYSSEIAMVLSEIEHAQKYLKRWMKPRHVAGTRLAWPSHGMIVSEPRGVVLIIGPWNYPVQLTLLPLVGALAAGCCATIKPSEGCPRTAEILARMIEKAFAPAHVAVVNGDASVAASLVREKWDFIFFTGGARAGRLVAEAAAKRLTPVILELGGKNPCIVDETARLDVAAKRIVWGRMMNAGQTCVAPDTVYVDARVAEQFLVHAVKACEQLAKVPMENGGVNCLLNGAAVERLSRFIKSGTVRCGGRGDLEQRTFEPTVVTGVAPGEEIWGEELFGPVLHVEAYDDFNSVVARVNAGPSPLAAYLFSEDRGRQSGFLDVIRAGSVCINDVAVQLFAKSLPFGGMGSSGMGRYHGEASLRSFSLEKSCLHCSTRLDFAWRYPPVRMPLETFRRVLKFLLKK